MRINLRSTDRLEIQMAPLIDCVFLLLIFFLVATTFKKVDKEVPMNLPESAAGAYVPREEDMYRIWIDRDGITYLDTGAVSTRALLDRLRIVARNSPDHS